MPVEIIVLGCGEAFDDRLPNNSYLVRAGPLLLIDCGFSIPHRLWHAERDDSAVDLIWISHAHADHYFGLPAVLGRMWERERAKPLTIMSQAPVLEQIRELMEAAYRGMAARFQYPIHYLAAKPWRWGDYARGTVALQWGGPAHPRGVFLRAVPHPRRHCRRDRHCARAGRQTSGAHAHSA